MGPISRIALMVGQRKLRVWIPESYMSSVPRVHWDDRTTRVAFDWAGVPPQSTGHVSVEGDAGQEQDPR